MPELISVLKRRGKGWGVKPETQQLQGFGVSEETTTNRGDKYFQIHTQHPHQINGIDTIPHTHRPGQMNTNPRTGVTSAKRLDSITTAADINYADRMIRKNTLRQRINRKDLGGY